VGAIAHPRGAPSCVLDRRETSRSNLARRRAIPAQVSGPAARDPAGAEPRLNLHHPRRLRHPAPICATGHVCSPGRASTGSVRTIFNRPSHPYTQALLELVPSMDMKTSRGSYSIALSRPHRRALWDRPRLRFPAARCTHADDRCRHEYPRVYPSARAPRRLLS